MRLAVTSDLHLDPDNNLTPLAEIEALRDSIGRAGPDALVLAGDLGVDLRSFEACVGVFRSLGVPVSVLAGNHDLWRDERAGLSSEALWGGALREAAERAGGLWLEGESLRLRDVAVVGTIGWYDYSAVDPGVRADHEQIASAKRQMNNDAYRIDWARSDRGFAAEVGEAFLGRLAAASADPGVRAVAVVTHVPLLEPQMVRKPHDERWGFSNAYFGNLTLGLSVLREPKLRAVVSGHTHVARRAELRGQGGAAIRAEVVGSDYGSPAYVLLEL